MMCEWLQFSRRCLLFALLKHPAARINPPTEEDVDGFSHAIGMKCPLLCQQKVHAACDGLKLPIEQSANFLKWNPLCNGQTGGTHINSVFVFSPDGLIGMATFNCPGSWHDSTTADCGICREMLSVHNRCGGKVVVNSAFDLTSLDCLIQLSQKDPVLKAVTYKESCRAIALKRKDTSLQKINSQQSPMKGCSMSMTEMCEEEKKNGNQHHQKHKLESPRHNFTDFIEMNQPRVHSWIPFS